MLKAKIKITRDSELLLMEVSLCLITSGRMHMQIGKSVEEMEKQVLDDAGTAAIMKVYTDAKKIIDELIPFEVTTRQVELYIATDRSG